MTIAGRYALDDQLGQGGMADVWAARDLRLRRDVAVKLLKPEVAARPDRRDRFEAEARSAASLNHPNVVLIFDSGEHDGIPYLVMERLPGRTMADEIAEGPLAPERAISMANDVLAAVGAAHEIGIIHRDIKPANVLLGPDGTAKVADFGIAKARAEVDVVTGDVILGTPGYLAPELLEGDPATPSSDIYSVGVLLYEALAGKAPFEGSSPVEVVKAVRGQHPPRLSDLHPDVPDRVAAAVERAMEKDPGRRFATAAEMAQALVGPSPAETQPLDLAETTTFERPGAPPAARWPRHLVLPGLIVLAACLIVWVAARSGGSNESPDASAGPAKPLPAGTQPIPAGRYTTTALLPGVTFTLDTGWSMPESEGPDVLTLRRGDLELSFLTIKRVFRADGRYATARDYLTPDSVEPAPRPLTDWLGRHPRLRATRPARATVDGAPAARIDVETAGGYASEACTGPCVPLFQLDAERPRYRLVKLEEGRSMRMYVRDVGDRIVAISIVAPKDGFERSIAPAESVIKTVR